MKKVKTFKLALKQALNIPVVSCSFVLYSNNIGGIKEYEKVNGEYIKLDEPIKFKMFGVYKHSFPCSLKQAMKNLACWKQILSFQRFYHSIGKDKETYIEEGLMQFDTRTGAHVLKIFRGIYEILSWNIKRKLE